MVLQASRDGEIKNTAAPPNRQEPPTIAKFLIIPDTLNSSISTILSAQHREITQIQAQVM
ncbi:hypothetical protein [Limnospira platensis]|uniref:hypothetical protein n=1 Tax=Limnospira platensis TaxID=118562 RepID=UPI0021AAC8F5